MADDFETLDELNAFIKEHGLPEAQVSYVSGDLNKIVEQEPKAGDKIDSSTVFKVKVGAGDVTVPNFLGKYESALRQYKNASDFNFELWRCPDSGGNRLIMHKCMIRIPNRARRSKKGPL